MNKIKVLHFICPTALYGAERWILALAKNYVNHDLIDCQLAVTYEHQGKNIEVYDKFKELGLKSHMIKTQGRFDPSVIFALYRLIRDQNIDIIHTHGYKSDILGIIAARLTGIKAVATPHGFENAKDFKLQFFIWLGCLALKYFDLVAPLSEELKHDMHHLKVNKNRIRLILNGIDIDEVERERNKKQNTNYLKPADEKLIGYVGQLSHRKNISVLLETFELLYKEHKNVRLILIGEGPQKSELEKKAKALSAGSRIEFLGYRDDRLSLVRQMDLFCMTSSLEGIPRSLMEAMAIETPVASFNIPGVDRLIINGQTGLMADFSNVQMLKLCWQRILFDKDLADKLSKNGREHILKNFSSKRMADEYTFFYKKLTTQK